MTENETNEIFNNCPYCGAKLPQGEFFCSSGNCASPASLVQNTQLTDPANSSYLDSNEVSSNTVSIEPKEVSSKIELKAASSIAPNLDSITLTPKQKSETIIQSKEESSATTDSQPDNLQVSKKKVSTKSNSSKEKTKVKKTSRNSTSISKSKQEPWKNFPVHEYIEKAKSPPSLIPQVTLLMIAFTLMVTFGFNFFMPEVIILLSFVTAILFIKLILDSSKFIKPKHTEIEWDKYISWLFDEGSSVVVAIEISVTAQLKRPYYVTVSLADENKRAVHKGLHVVYSNFNGKTHLREIFGQSTIEKNSSPMKRVAKCYWELKYDPKTMVIELEDLVLFCRERDL